MLNKIMMTGRIVTDLTIVTVEDYSYCKFSIAVDQQNATIPNPWRLIYSLVSLSMITQNQ